MHVRHPARARLLAATALTGLSLLWTNAASAQEASNSVE